MELTEVEEEEKAQQEAEEPAADTDAEAAVFEEDVSEPDVGLVPQLEAEPSDNDAGSADLNTDMFSEDTSTDTSTVAEEVQKVQAADAPAEEINNVLEKAIPETDTLDSSTKDEHPEDEGDKDEIIATYSADKSAGEANDGEVAGTHSDEAVEEQKDEISDGAKVESVGKEDAPTAGITSEEAAGDGVVETEATEFAKTITDGPTEDALPEETEKTKAEATTGSEVESTSDTPESKDASADEVALTDDPKDDVVFEEPVSPEDAPEPAAEAVAEEEAAAEDVVSAEEDAGHGAADVHESEPQPEDRSNAEEAGTEDFEEHVVPLAHEEAEYEDASHEVDTIGTCPQDEAAAENPVEEETPEAATEGVTAPGPLAKANTEEGPLDGAPPDESALASEPALAGEEAAPVYEGSPAAEKFGASSLEDSKDKERSHRRRREHGRERERERDKDILLNGHKTKLERRKEAAKPFVNQYAKAIDKAKLEQHARHEAPEYREKQRRRREKLEAQEQEDKEQRRRERRERQEEEQGSKENEHIARKMEEKAGEAKRKSREVEKAAKAAVAVAEGAHKKKNRRESFADSGSGGSSSGTARPSLLKRMTTGESVGHGPLLMIPINKAEDGPRVSESSRKGKEKEREAEHHESKRSHRPRELGSRRHEESESSRRTRHAEPTSTRRASSRTERYNRDEEAGIVKLGRIMKAVLARS